MCEARDWAGVQFAQACLAGSRVGGGGAGGIASGGSGGGARRVGRRYRPGVLPKHRTRAGIGGQVQKCGAGLAGSAEGFCLAEGYAATDFFAAFGYRPLLDEAIGRRAVG